MTSQPNLTGIDHLPLVDLHRFYLPHEHNIKKLGSWCEAIDLRLVEAWPRGPNKKGW
jgi:hypothetical protein